MLDKIHATLDVADWGNVPEWFAAVGTVGALVVALALLGREAQRDKRRHDERRAEQASQVAAWVEWRDAITVEGHGASGPGLYCFLQNSSASPVHEVILHFPSGTTGLATDHLDTLPPSEPRPRMLPRTVSSNPADYDVLRVLISFVDNAGRRWRRTHDGTLVDRGPAKRDESGEDTD